MARREEVVGEDGEELAEEQFALGDGAGAEHFDAAGAVFLGEHAHGERRDDDEGEVLADLEEAADLGGDVGMKDAVLGAEDDGHREEKAGEDEVGDRGVEESGELAFGDGGDTRHGVFRIKGRDSFGKRSGTMRLSAAGGGVGGVDKELFKTGAFEAHFAEAPAAFGDGAGDVFVELGGEFAGDQHVGDGVGGGREGLRRR